MPTPPPHELDFGPYTAAFVEGLVRDVPQLSDAYREHLNDNFGELLPHVFLGDVTRWVVAVSQKRTDHDALATLLARMDAILSDPSHPCRELVLASFVENLGGETEALKVIRPISGRSLSAALEQCW